MGATRRRGMWPAPLGDRFGISHTLDFSADEERTPIVPRPATILKARVDAAGAREISRRSRGTPRIVNRLLRRGRGHAPGNGRRAPPEAGGGGAPRREGGGGRGGGQLDPPLPAAVAGGEGGGAGGRPG